MAIKQKFYLEYSPKLDPREKTDKDLPNGVRKESETDETY